MTRDYELHDKLHEDPGPTPGEKMVAKQFTAGFEGKQKPNICELCARGLGPGPFLYRLALMMLKLCPKCAGRMNSALVRYHQGRKRDGLQGARKNLKAKKPLYLQGVWRCRNCEVQLPDYKVGDPPTCEECR